MMQLGKQCMEVFPITSTLNPLAGDVAYILGFFIALVLWGFGLAWLFFAVAAVTRNKFPFNMGWWGFTFPLGVFAMATLSIAEELPSEFFKIVGTVLAVCVMLLLVLVAINTVRSAWKGTLFHAPCLDGLEDMPAARNAQP
jgi:tellurite resistance protein TehA-like permease